MERLDKHFKQLTRVAYEKHGAAFGDVLSQWEAIAGEKLARQTRPLKLRWPRQGASRQKYGGLLTVQAVPGFAMELQYETPRLIERVNGYLGYGAIAAIKIVQGEFARPPRDTREAPALSPADEKALKERLAGIAEAGLKDALTRLGAGVKSRKSA